MNEIHPTAIIGEKVKLGENIKIAPYALLDGDIELGDGCEVGPYVHLTGWVKIGQRTRIYSAAAIGEPPQDYSYDGTPGLVEIGDDCIIREYVTIHTPVGGDKGEKTIVENGAFLMANSHVAHNVKVGQKAVLANGVLLAGYVEVGERAFLSGNIGVHQFCRVGEYVIIGPVAKIIQDVPPYMMVDGNPGTVRGLNVVGLRRGGFDQEQRTKIKEAYKLLYSGTGYREACDEIEKQFGNDRLIMRLVEFVRATKRGIVDHYGKS